jgi:hypothetical protein
MNFEPIQQKSLIRLYPTSHIFNVPLNTLKKSILHTFKNANSLTNTFYNDLVFHYYWNSSDGDKRSKMTVRFIPETSNDKLFSKEFFSTTGTENDIYLHSYGQYWNSPIYYARGKPLEFRAQFRIILKSLNSTQTLLKVEVENPRVIKGISGIGPHGFICKEIVVKPTTIEEYCLILYIANQIGDNSLLPLNLKKNIK